MVKSFDGFYHDLLDMVNAGKINEAENLLSYKLDYADKKDLCDAINFYGYLNSLDDEFLEENNYTREEISLGLKNIASIAGMESIVDVFSQE